jgi:AcrR family transcriptional regulator
VTTGRATAVASPDRTDRRRSEIIDVARRLFGERGSLEVSMDEIAAGAGVVRSTLYVYFPNRTELLVGCVASMYAQMTDVLGEEVDTTPAEGLVRLITALLTTIDEDPIFFRLAMAVQSAPSPAGAAVSAQIGGIGEEVAARVIGLLEEGTSEGTWKVPDPSTASILIGQQIYGALAVRSATGPIGPADVAAREIVAFLTHGLAGHSA